MGTIGAEKDAKLKGRGPTELRKRGVPSRAEDRVKRRRSDKGTVGGRAQGGITSRTSLFAFRTSHFTHCMVLEFYFAFILHRALCT